MLVYSVIMFIMSAVFAGVSVAICKGKTDLIHDYHQTKVSDKAAYGRAFGKAMLVIAMAMLSSGIIGLFGDSEKIAMISVVILFIGLAVGIACIIAVQKKYNNGIF